METREDIKNQTETQQAQPAAETPKHPLPAWLSISLALLAWLLLMLFDGYAALIAGVAGIGIAIWGIAANRGGLRKIAITALIASLVLVIVVASFLIVLKIGLA